MKSYLESYFIYTSRLPHFNPTSPTRQLGLVLSERLRFGVLLSNQYLDWQVSH